MLHIFKNMQWRQHTIMDFTLDMEKYGVTGMIIGKALYTGKVDLKTAIKIVKEYEPEKNRLIKKTKKQKKGSI